MSVGPPILQGTFLRIFVHQSLIVTTNPMDVYATVLNRSTQYLFETVMFALNNTCLTEAIPKKRVLT